MVRAVSGHAIERYLQRVEGFAPGETPGLIDEYRDAVESILLTPMVVQALALTASGGEMKVVLSTCTVVCNNGSVATVLSNRRPARSIRWMSNSVREVISGVCACGAKLSRPKRAGKIRSQCEDCEELKRAADKRSAYSRKRVTPGSSRPREAKVEPAIWRSEKP